MIHLELTLKITLYLCLVFPHFEENSIKTKPKRKKGTQSLQKSLGRSYNGYRSSTHGKCSEKGEGIWFILMLRWHKAWLGFTAPGPASSTTSDKPLKTWFLAVFGHVKIQRSTYQKCTYAVSLCSGTAEIRIPSPSLSKPYTIRREARKGRVLTSFERWGAASLHSSALHFTYPCARSVKIAVLFESLWAGSWPELAKRK